jgi:hypothetical protein
MMPRVYNDPIGTGCGMRSLKIRSDSSRLLAFLLALSSLSLAGNAPAAKITPKTRQEIIHAFSDELVFIRTNFPMGKSGLKLKNGTTTPNGQELQQLMALWGPAAKPGDRARISTIVIKDDHIHFEINGGPVRWKWYQHVHLDAGVSAQEISPGDPSANARGSYVDLYFDKYVPDLTGPELKQLLRPVFDFDSKTGVEAYLETVSPQVRDAIKNHHVLVGMNHDMVLYAKGRAPRKVRERADDVEYEEWIYGEPPQDVDFVRFVGDEVVRVETMKVDGQKIVRVDKEVDLGTKVAKQSERPATAPTLRRPGEEMPQSSPANPSTMPPVAPPAPPSGPGSDPGPQMEVATPATN